MCNWEVKVVANLSQIEAPLHVDESPSAVDENKKKVANMGSYGWIKPSSFVPTHFAEMSENE